MDCLGETLFRGAGRPASAILALLLMLVLAACASGTQPFAKSPSISGGGKTAPPINLLSVEGLPPDKLQAFKDALAQSAGKRDMAIVEGAFEDGSFGLSGRFQAVPAGGEVRVVYNWTLTDKKGAVLHTIAAEERAPGGGAEPWAAVTPEVLQRVAAYTAESLSSRLSQLGYATQLGGLPPPLESFALATPESGKQIDLETWNGPAKADPAMVAAAASLPAADPVSTASVTPAEPATSAKAANATPADAAPKHKAGPIYDISAVAVVPVSGSPGQGNVDLTNAMRRTLETAGWPVLDAPRKNALTIGGEVEMGEPRGGVQKVSLAWTVALPDGKVLGTIRQANDVPAGSLDHGWGDLALQAAEAAATGIFDLVKKLR